MARTRITGFEAQDIVVDSGGTSTVLASGMSYESTIVRTGTGSLKCVPASGTNNTMNIAPLNPSTDFMRIYVRVTVLPATARILIGDTGQLNIRLNPSGTLALYNLTTLQGTSSTALTDTTKWYRVEFRGGTATSVPILQIDGGAEITGSPSSWSAPPSVGAADTVAATYTAYFDDFASDNAAYPGAGQAALLVPTSDNAIGGWTGGAGATTNLFDAVNNKPPIGKTVASETDLTQIKSPTNSATDNCDLNMTTYTAAGLLAGATVNGVQAVCAHAEEIATSTKTGALKIVSNPAQSVEDTFTYGGDAGAVGTYASNWTVTAGTTQNAPSVTLGTAPVLRIGKRTATTRVVDCCFMGIYVDYTPAVVGDIGGMMIP